MRLCNKLSSWRNHQSDLITDLAIPAGGIQLPLEIIPSKAAQKRIRFNINDETNVS